MVGIVNKPDINYGIWASNGDVAVPSSEKVEIGHIVEKPKKEIVNWIENRQDQFMAYLNQVGISEWDSKTTYKANISFVNRSGTVYKAKSQNIDKDPTLNQDIWGIAWSTYEDYLSVVSDLEKIKEQEGYLSLYVSNANPTLDVEIKGIGYGNSDLTSSFNFNNGNPSIKKDGEIVAEFSGDKSGKDVVTFEDLQEATKIKVGDLYTTTVNENPSLRLGYGNWVRFAEGRTIVGYSSDPTSATPDWVKVVGNTFGSYEHKLTVSEMPKHNHRQSGSTDGGGATGYQMDYNNSPQTQATNVFSEDSGGDQPHNNVQPSIVVFIWLRTS